MHLLSLFFFDNLCLYFIYTFLIYRWPIIPFACLADQFQIRDMYILEAIILFFFFKKEMHLHLHYYYSSSVQFLLLKLLFFMLLQIIKKHHS